MIIYRPHRGSLDRSMEEVKEFNNEKEMKEYIVKEWDNLFSVDDIVIDGKSINDDRISWEDVRYVCTKRCGKEDYIKKYNSPQCR